MIEAPKLLAALLDLAQRRAMGQITDEESKQIALKIAQECLRQPEGQGEGQMGQKGNYSEEEIDEPAPVESSYHIARRGGFQEEEGEPEEYYAVTDTGPRRHGTPNYRTGFDEVADRMIGGSAEGHESRGVREFKRPILNSQPASRHGAPGHESSHTGRTHPPGGHSNDYGHRGNAKAMSEEDIQEQYSEQQGRYKRRAELRDESVEKRTAEEERESEDEVPTPTGYRDPDPERARRYTRYTSRDTTPKQPRKLPPTSGYPPTPTKAMSEQDIRAQHAQQERSTKRRWEREDELDRKTDDENDPDYRGDQDFGTGMARVVDEMTQRELPPTKSLATRLKSVRAKYRTKADSEYGVISQPEKPVHSYDSNRPDRHGGIQRTIPPDPNDPFGRPRYEDVVPLGHSAQLDDELDTEDLGDLPDRVTRHRQGPPGRNPPESGKAIPNEMRESHPDYGLEPAPNIANDPNYRMVRHRDEEGDEPGPVPDTSQYPWNYDGPRVDREHGRGDMTYPRTRVRESSDPVGGDYITEPTEEYDNREREKAMSWLQGDGSHLVAPPQQGNRVIRLRRTTLGGKSLSVPVVRRRVNFKAIQKTDFNRGVRGSYAEPQTGVPAGPLDPQAPGGRAPHSVPHGSYAYADRYDFPGTGSQGYQEEYADEPDVVRDAPPDDPDTNSPWETQARHGRNTSIRGEGRQKGKTITQSPDDYPTREESYPRGGQAAASPHTRQRSGTTDQAWGKWHGQLDSQGVEEELEELDRRGVFQREKTVSYPETDDDPTGLPPDEDPRHPTEEAAWNKWSEQVMGQTVQEEAAERQRRKPTN